MNNATLKRQRLRVIHDKMGGMRMSRFTSSVGLRPTTFTWHNLSPSLNPPHTPAFLSFNPKRPNNRPHTLPTLSRPPPPPQQRKKYPPFSSSSSSSPSSSPGSREKAQSTMLRVRRRRLGGRGKGDRGGCGLGLCVCRKGCWEEEEEEEVEGECQDCLRASCVCVGYLSR